MKCWNCLQENRDKAHRCESCDQPLKPSPAQRVSSSGALKYVLHELDNWDFVDQDSRNRLRAVYSIRLDRLAGEISTDLWPVSDWHAVPLPLDPLEQVGQVPEAAPVSHALIDTEENVDTVPPVPEKIPSGPTILESLVGEAEVRWFHSLGAILVVAAVVGWLRASWDSYGKTIAGALIFASPFGLHLLASRLRHSVPLSARLLSILASILTPPALLSVDIFGSLPPGIPSNLYWTLSLLLSSALLSWQAHLTRERVPLYLGGLCAVTAGWPQGALATACFSLGVGFLFARQSDPEQPEWDQERRQVSFYAGSFGALATLLLFETDRHPLVPVTAFSAALVFLNFPILLGQEQASSRARLILQAVLSIVGSVMMRAVLDLSAGGVALYLLLAAGLFLAAKPDSLWASMSVKLAGVLGGLGLVIGFLSDLPTVLSARQSPPEAVLRLLFSLLATAFYAHAARRKESPTLLLLGLLSILGGWIHFFLYFLARGPVESVDQLATLLSTIPLLLTFLLLTSRWALLQEQTVVWQFCTALVTLTSLVTCVGSYAENDTGWKVALVLHTALLIVWERQWVVRCPSPEVAQVLPGLPRLATATVAVLLLCVLPEDSQILFTTALLLTVACQFLRASYAEACWEAAWLLNIAGLFILPTPFLLAASAFSVGLARPILERKEASLLLTALTGTYVVALAAEEVYFPFLFLPALLCAVALASPGARRQGWRESPRGRLSFDMLLAAAVLWTRLPSSPGSGPSVAWCLLLGLLAFGLDRAQHHSLMSRFVSPHSSGTLFGAALLWSLWRTPLEFGLLLTMAGLAVALSRELPKFKWDLANALTLVGLAQMPTANYLALDPVALSSLLLVSEGATLWKQRQRPCLSNLALLGLLVMQAADSEIPIYASYLTAAALLLLAGRTVQQNNIKVAATALAFLVVLIDVESLALVQDLRWRALPSAILLVSASVWKWNTLEPWTRLALRLGLALSVTPALGQFLAGIALMENFLWTLSFGSLFIGLSFPLKEQKGHIFRQAGGITLTGWAAVSLTRAAMILPWQAATLVIGVVLVAIGVGLERRHRAAKNAPEQAQEEL